MEKEFNVEIMSFINITETEGAWATDDYVALLSMMGLPEDQLVGISEQDLKEMCLMSFRVPRKIAAVKVQ